jgi:hypothetical protein
VNAISELMLLLLMTVAVILAYRKLTQLDINNHPISLLDDLLLFVCIPAFFLYGIFSIVPAVLKNNGLSIAITLLQVSGTSYGLLRFPAASHSFPFPYRSIGLINDAYQLHTLCNVEFEMMRKGVVVANFRILYHRLSGGTEENRENPQTR